MGAAGRERLFDSNGKSNKVEAGAPGLRRTHDKGLLSIASVTSGLRGARAGTFVRWHVKPGLNDVPVVDHSNGSDSS